VEGFKVFTAVDLVLLGAVLVLCWLCCVLVLRVSV
jgi:hypothetical protein